MHIQGTLLWFTASKLRHLGHEACLWAEHSHMLSGQNKLCSVVDHPNYVICIFNNPDFTHSEVFAPRDEEQQDRIVLMVEWLMMIALPFFCKWITRWPLKPTECSRHSNELVEPTNSPHVLVRLSLPLLIVLLLSQIMEHFCQRSWRHCIWHKAFAKTTRDLRPH